MTTHELLLAAKAAAPALAWLGSEEKNAAILRMADAIVRETDVILAANEADVQAAKGTISDVMLDRLRLTQARIAAMADGGRGMVLLCLGCALVLTVFVLLQREDVSSPGQADS